MAERGYFNEAQYAEPRACFPARKASSGDCRASLLSAGEGGGTFAQLCFQEESGRAGLLPSLLLLKCLQLKTVLLPRWQVGGQRVRTP